MNKKEMAERMLVTGCTLQQIRYATKLEVTYQKEVDQTSHYLLVIHGQHMAYATVKIPTKNRRLNNH